ncbi:MAG: ABC transporter permease [Lentisphaerae bacterium]|nr:ABC transporter permease [Lentisphaerota bacterium]
MLNLFKIAGNTFKESIREPIFALLLMCSVLLIANFPFVAIFVFYDQVKLVVDSSMATTMLFGLFAAVLCSSHTVSREMRDGTVLLLFSKPVFRATFILGKISGIMLSSMLFVLVCNAASVVATYIAIDPFRVDWVLYYVLLGLVVLGAGVGMVMNFARGSSFPAILTLFMTAALPLMAIFVMIFKEIPPEVVLRDLLLAFCLLFFAVAAMATLSVVFATRLNMVSNLVVSTALFVAGLMSSYLVHPVSGKLFAGSGVGTALRTLLHALLPNWQLFWLADALATRKTIPLSYVGFAALYVVLYIGLCSMWAVMVFQDKEIAKDSR